MKLTNELQNKLGNAKSEDEVKKILAKIKQNVEEAGIILEDSELDHASGGMYQVRERGPKISNKPRPWDQPTE